MRKEEVGDGTEEVTAVTGEAERVNRLQVASLWFPESSSVVKRAVTTISGIPETTQHLKHEGAC